MNRKSLLLLALILLMAIVAAPAQHSKRPPTLPKKPSLPEVTITIPPEEQVRRSLLALGKIPRTQKNATTVPQEARTQLMLTKAALAKVVVAALNAEPTQLADAALNNYIEGYLQSRGIREASATETGGRCPQWYGCIYGVEVKHVTKHPQLLALTTALQIPYGDDCSFYVLEHASDGWRVTLRFENNSYAE